MRRQLDVGLAGEGKQPGQLPVEDRAAPHTPDAASAIRLACSQVKAKAVIDENDPGRYEDDDASALTPAQVAVLQLVAHGFTNPEIAAVRGTSIETVKTQMRGVLNRLGAHHRAHAVAIALRESLIS